MPRRRGASSNPRRCVQGARARRRREEELEPRGRHQATASQLAAHTSHKAGRQRGRWEAVGLRIGARKREVKQEEEGGRHLPCSICAGRRPRSVAAATSRRQMDMQRGERRSRADDWRRQERTREERGQAAYIMQTQARSRKLLSSVSSILAKLCVHEPTYGVSRQHTTAGRGQTAGRRVCAMLPGQGKRHEDEASLRPVGNGQAYRRHTPKTARAARGRCKRPAAHMIYGNVRGAHEGGVGLVASCLPAARRLELHYVGEHEDNVYCSAREGVARLLPSAAAACISAT